MIAKIFTYPIESLSFFTNLICYSLVFASSYFYLAFLQRCVHGLGHTNHEFLFWEKLLNDGSPIVGVVPFLLSLTTVVVYFSNTKIFKNIQLISLRNTLAISLAFLSAFYGILSLLFLDTINTVFNQYTFIVPTSYILICTYTICQFIFKTYRFQALPILIVSLVFFIYYLFILPIETSPYVSSILPVLFPSKKVIFIYLFSSLIFSFLLHLLLQRSNIKNIPIQLTCLILSHLTLILYAILLLFSTITKWHACQDSSHFDFQIYALFIIVPCFIIFNISIIYISKVYTSLKEQVRLTNH